MKYPKLKLEELKFWNPTTEDCRRLVVLMKKLFKGDSHTKVTITLEVSLNKKSIIVKEDTLKSVEFFNGVKKPRVATSTRMVEKSPTDWIIAIAANCQVDDPFSLYHWQGNCPIQDLEDDILEQDMEFEEIDIYKECDATESDIY